MDNEAKIQGSLRPTAQDEMSNKLPDSDAGRVPEILYDGGTINVTMEEHDAAIGWCKQEMGMNIAQQENWTPGPEAAVGKMTHMGWGVWIESGKTKEGAPAPPSNREPVDSNIFWYWSIRNLQLKHDEFMRAGVETSPIYKDCRGREVFDFRFMNTGTWLTAVEDPSLKDDAFADANEFRIKVRSLPRSVEWYRRFLGMEVQEDQSNERFCVMTLGVNYQPEGRSTWVLEEDPGLLNFGPIDGLFRTRCHVDGREAFFDFHRFLEESGAHVSAMGGFIKRGKVVFNVYDPDGNRFDLSHH